MRSRLTCLVASVIAVALSATSNAALITSSTSNPPLNGSGSVTLGDLILIGATPLTINALGVQDTGTTGIVANTQVGLWSSDSTGATATMVTSTTVPAGTGATLLNSYRYVQLGSPVILNANSYYLIGASSSNNSTAENAGEGFSGGVVYSSGDPDVTFVRSQFSSSAFAAPTSNGGSPTTRWGAGNAEFLTPEPTSIAMVACGIGIFLMNRRRTTRQ